MRRLGLAFAAAVTVALIAAAPGGALAVSPRVQTDGTTTKATVDQAYALVQLKGAPLAGKRAVPDAPPMDAGDPASSGSLL